MSDVFAKKLSKYLFLTKVKPPPLKTHFPYVAMDARDIEQTIKKIKLEWSLIPEVQRPKFKKGGAVHPITVICI